MQQGVTCSTATNNVLNSFTPFSDTSLLRMANFYANIEHKDPADFPACLELVTHLPARLMKLSDCRIAVGSPADFVVLDAPHSSDALAELAEPRMVFKNGRQTVRREPEVILRD